MRTYYAVIEQTIHNDMTTEFNTLEEAFRYYLSKGGERSGGMIEVRVRLK